MRWPRDWFEIVAGLPVPVAHGVRGKRRKCFTPEEANLGRGGTDKRFYCGVSLLLCVTGLVTAPANDAERWAFSALLTWRHDPTAVPMEVDAIPTVATPGRPLIGPVGHQLSPTTAGHAVTDVYLADRGVAGADWQQAWTARCDAQVITPDQLAATQRHGFHHARQRIDPVPGVLTDVLHIACPQARTEEGLITRIVSKCAALNLGILINRHHHRPDLALGTLFRG